MIHTHTYPLGARPIHLCAARGGASCLISLMRLEEEKISWCLETRLSRVVNVCGRTQIPLCPPNVEFDCFAGVHHITSRDNIP